MDWAALAAIAAVAGAGAGWVPVLVARRADREALRDGLGALGDRLTRIEARLEERDRSRGQLGTAYQAQQRASAEHVCAGPHSCYWRDREQGYERRTTDPRGIPIVGGDE